MSPFRQVHSEKWVSESAHFIDKKAEAQRAQQAVGIPGARKGPGWDHMLPFSPTPLLHERAFAGSSSLQHQPLCSDPEGRDAGWAPGERPPPAGRQDRAADPALLPEAHPCPAAQGRRAAAPAAPGKGGSPGRALPALSQEPLRLPVAGGGGVTLLPQDFKKQEVVVITYKPVCFYKQLQGERLVAT